MCDSGRTTRRALYKNAQKKTDRQPIFLLFPCLNVLSILTLMLKNYLWIFFISMLPLIELRGAVPVSQALGLPLLTSYIVCIVGNMLPVPFIYLFARRFLEWGANKKFIGKICAFFLIKGEKGGRKLKEKAGRGLFVALTLFVGIPIPGTGAWTGTLAASLLDMNFKDTVAAVTAGVLIAGVIMGLASAGVFGAAGALFNRSLRF